MSNAIVYKMSKKGQKKLGYHENTGIIFFEQHYIFVRKTDGGWNFEPNVKGNPAQRPGDVAEWKPRFKKPDSFWEKSETINTKKIGNVEMVSEYNADIVKKLIGISK
jgi:hypothetical protein